MAGLKQIKSPFAELYAKSYSKKESVEADLTTFFDEHMKGRRAGELEPLEAKALVYWIFKTANRAEERMQVVEQLMEGFAKEYPAEGELAFVKGIVYFRSRVDIHFVSSLEVFNRALKNAAISEGSFYYRGHSNANFMLMPSVMRERNWRRHERDMYNELMIQCPQDFEKTRTHLDVLVQMQHYGLPTRLLDITRNPLVAMYFACESNTETPGEIVVFQVDRRKIKYPNSDTVSLLASLSLFSHDEQMSFLACATGEYTDKPTFNKGIARLIYEVKSEKPAFRDEVNREDLLNCFVVMSPKTNNRIIKQDGAFILCGLAEDNSRALNDMRHKSAAGQTTVYLVENKKGMMEQLQRFSITKASLFPEIDDVADYIKSKYWRQAVRAKMENR